MLFPFRLSLASGTGVPDMLVIDVPGFRPKRPS
jgi:hypothetical protein